MNVTLMNRLNVESDLKKADNITIAFILHHLVYVSNNFKLTLYYFKRVYDDDCKIMYPCRMLTQIAHRGLAKFTKQSRIFLSGGREAGKRSTRHFPASAIERKAT